jgi:tetratricopeptide (TPR) repeat protein
MPTQLLPTALPTETTVEAEQILRVRVYAGAAYRARVMGWESELDKVLASASILLQEASGTRLELVESIDWKLSGGNLAKALKSLQSFDRAVDVDLVVGLIDAAPEVEDNYSKLLAADLLDGHLVMRSYNREAESAALGSPASTLDEATKDELIERRRRHKQTLIMVQALSKAFGGGVAQRYETTDTKLDASAGEILRITMGARIQASVPGAAAKSIWQDASEKLANLDAGPELVEAARQVGLGNEGGKKQGEDDVDTLRAVDRETLGKVLELLEDGEAAAAWAQLEPLTELYPAQEDIVDLACAVSAARAAKDAIGRCKAATLSNANNGQSWLRLGGLQLAGDPTAAIQSLRRAHKSLADSDRGWATLARAYRSLSLPSLALSASQKAKNQKAVAKTIRWALETRSRYGSNVGVEEESEGRYLVALKDGLKLVYKNDFKAAAVAAADLGSSFPKSIASDLMQCELGVRRRKYIAAQRACQAVISRQSENAWSRYLLGVVSMRERKEAKAIEFWTEAITRDPGLKAAYQGLGKVYRKRSDARLAALKTKYKEQFGADLE